MEHLLVRMICIIFAKNLCKLQSHYVFLFILYYRLFFAVAKANNETCVDGSPNPEFTRENNSKTILNQVEFVDALSHVYKGGKCENQNTPYLLSNVDSLKLCKGKN